MNKIILFFVCLTLFLYNKTIAQNFDIAGEYMSFISKQQQNISKKFMSYASASGRGKKARKVENLRQKLLNEVQEARMNINGMPSYKGDKAYRDSAVSFMKLYYNVLNEDYAKIINMEDVAEQSYDEMEAYMLAKELVDKKLENGNTTMQMQQKTFAASYNINLVDGTSSLSEMVKLVHNINLHYKEVFLLFFKPYIQESNLTKAISQNNVTAIEQSKVAMIQYAKEGLEKVKKIKGYEGDMSLINALKAVLQFYVKEGNKVNAVHDYMLAKEKFELLKKENDKKGNRTQKDVDDYNAGVAEINKAAATFNKTMNELNAERTESLNIWNKAVDNFYAEYTPKYK